MGGTKILIGSGNSGEADKAPFDVQYQYINNVAPLESCMTSCKADTSCGGWWGCWQWNELPPASQYPVSFASDKAKLTWQGQPHPQLVSWTYYSLRFLAGGAEGQAEFDILNDTAQLKRYFADYRFFLQKIGDTRSMVHLEPDFWGFVRGATNDPQTMTAKVNEANPTDCPAASHQNNVAGFARCLITMARKYAPNSSVGLHASPWTWSSTADAQSLGTFMNALGANDADFIALDVSDRDAGWYEVANNDKSKWWNDQAFVDYFVKLKALTETIGKPAILWQLPLGNSLQNNTDQHYKDDKVEYLFSRIDEVAAAHVVGLLFGPGDTPQTNIATDGGLLISKTTSYWKSGGTTIK
jgi:hypothetical protein